MLSKLLTKSRGVLIATLILIIPSFVLAYGWSSIQQRQAQEANRFAKFREKNAKWHFLSNDQVRQGQMELQRDAASTFGEQGAALMAEILKESSSDVLFPNRDSAEKSIRMWLLQKFANEEGIYITDDELRVELNQQLVTRDPDTGAIRNLTPEEAQYYLRKSMAAIELEIKQNLRMNRARFHALSQAKISDLELWENYSLQNEQLTLDLVKFPVKNYEEKVEINDALLEMFLADNPDTFREGTKRQYKYASLKKRHLDASEIQIEDSELREYYEKNSDNYLTPRKTKVREIFLKLDVNDEMTDEAREAATSATLSVVEQVKSALKAGEDFSQIANRFSDAPENTTTDGQKLGGLVVDWISNANMVDYGYSYVNAANKLEPGMVSEPFRTTKGEQQGYSIIKCDEVRLPQPQSFEVARVEIEDVLRAEKLDELFEEKRDAIDNAIDDYNEVAGIAKDFEMNDGLTSWVLTTQNYLRLDLGLLSPDELSYLNDSMEIGEISPLMGSGSTCYLVQVVGERPPTVPTLSEIHDKVEQVYRTQRALELAEKAAEEFRKDLANLEQMQKRAEELGLKVQTTESVKRERLDADGSEVLEILSGGLIDGLSQISFIKQGDIQLSRAGNSDDQVNAVIVWHLTELKEADRAAFDSEKAKLHAAMITARQRRMLDEWMWDKVAELEIVYNDR